MELQVKSADRNLLLEMKGELDHHGARNALRELELSIDAALPKKLVLDLAGVTFMDSSGIALILRAQQRMQLLDGSLLVRNVPQQSRWHFPAAAATRGSPGQPCPVSPPRWIPPSTSWRTSRPPSARR